MTSSSSPSPAFLSPAVLSPAIPSPISPSEASPRATLTQLEGSKIREVANAALGLKDVLPFWFGEPDSVTPAYIRDAAKAALDRGDTFYHHNLGLPALREALAAYLNREGSRTMVTSDRIAVTSSGVNALMLACQAILEPGDEVVAVVPLWPNLTEIPRILNAKVRRVSLDFSADGGWSLNLERLIDAIGPGTRAVIINSPNNPSGWTMSRQDQALLLEHCRRLGVWILSDEAYDRLIFDGSYQAPSMLDHATEQDRVLIANTFSKTWQMTGWRLGWLVGPPAVIDALGKLIEFNTSCAPGFVQAAGVVAVREGETDARKFVDTLKLRRDHLLKALAGLDRIRACSPPGAMYLFFQIDGMQDSLATCKALVRDYGLGLAPGAAFGEESAAFIRWCFAKDNNLLEQGADRLKKALRDNGIR